MGVTMERRGAPARTAVRAGRLLFAQVHEDPRLEIEAFDPVLGEKIAVVASGGCTALSLLASGASDVIAIDLNPAENHVVELKAAAMTRLGPEARTAFLGGWPAPARSRRVTYRELQGDLTGPARRYWDEHLGDIENGLLGAGVSERFMAGISRTMRLLVHPRSRIERLLACRTLEEQGERYEREWNSWRWRLVFALLLGRRSINRAYDEPAMFTQVAHRNFGAQFHARFQHTVTKLPVADNYFLHYALLGRYPATLDGLPPYLAAPRGRGNLSLVAGTFTGYLATQPGGSIGGFSLSNICEWLDDAAIDALFAEIVRTATPGAVLCFRNFVGWTEVPERWRGRVIEDRARGRELLARDRSLVNRRFAVCRIAEGA